MISAPNIQDLATQIQDLWNLLGVPETEQSVFRSLHLSEAIPSAANIQVVEWEVSRLCRYAELTAETIDLIEKREALLRESTLRKPVPDEIVRSLSDVTKRVEDSIIRWHEFNIATVGESPNAFVWNEVDYGAKMRTDVVIALSDGDAEHNNNHSCNSGVDGGSSSRNNNPAFLGSETLNSTATTEGVLSPPPSTTVHQQQEQSYNSNNVTDIKGSAYAIGEFVATQYKSSLTNNTSKNNSSSSAASGGASPRYAVPEVYRSPGKIVPQRTKVVVGSKINTSPERKFSNNEKATNNNNKNENLDSANHAVSQQQQPIPPPARYYVNEELNKARLELRAELEELEKSRSAVRAAAQLETSEQKHNSVGGVSNTNSFRQKVVRFPGSGGGESSAAPPTPAMQPHPPEQQPSSKPITSPTESTFSAKPKPSNIQIFGELPHAPPTATTATASTQQQPTIATKSLTSTTTSNVMPPIWTQLELSWGTPSWVRSKIDMFFEEMLQKETSASRMQQMYEVLHNCQISDELWTLEREESLQRALLEDDELMARDELEHDRMYKI